MDFSLFPILEKKSKLKEAQGT